MIGTIIEATVMIIIFGLILAHADNFGKAAQSVGNVYSEAVKTLAGVAGPPQ